VEEKRGSSAVACKLRFAATGDGESLPLLFVADSNGKSTASVGIGRSLEVRFLNSPLGLMAAAAAALLVRFPGEEGSFGGLFWIFPAVERAVLAVDRFWVGARAAEMLRARRVAEPTAGAGVEAEAVVSNVGDNAAGGFPTLLIATSSVVMGIIGIMLGVGSSVGAVAAAACSSSVLIFCRCCRLSVEGSFGDFLPLVVPWAAAVGAARLRLRGACEGNRIVCMEWT
jgi:hypothetical protein